VGAVRLQPGMVTPQVRFAVDVDCGEGAGYDPKPWRSSGRGPGMGGRDRDVVFDFNMAALEKLTVEALTRTSAKQ